MMIASGLLMYIQMYYHGQIVSGIKMMIPLIKTGCFAANLC